MSKKELSHLQLEKDELTFIFNEENPPTLESKTEVSILYASNKVMEVFQDMMPDDLPKRLPLKGVVDHTIKLVEGVKLVS